MKCKVCGFRLGNDMKKCPMCGAVAGSTVAGNINPDVNLQKSFCPSCGKEVLGEHRYCPSCGADLKNAGKTAAAHAQDSIQSQHVSSKLQNAPQTKNSQHSESQVFQQAQQNVAEQKDKLKLNKNAFGILSTVTVILMIINAITALSMGESPFSAILEQLGGGAMFMGMHCWACLSDSKGTRKYAIIVDSIVTALFFAIIFGCFLYRVVL